MKTLVLFAHPRTDRSEINAPLLEAARSVDGVNVVDLYAEYPAFDVDVDREQRRLVDHDAIVVQHPLYWYSVPALVKEWLDLVFEHGFAYGHHGHELDGKVAMHAVSCGAKRTAYTPEGANGAEIRSLLLPFEKSYDLCRMRYLAPFILFGAGRALDEGRVDGHIDDYRRLLQALVDERLDLEGAASALTVSDDLSAFIDAKEPV